MLPRRARIRVCGFAILDIRGRKKPHEKFRKPVAFGVHIDERKTSRGDFFFLHFFLLGNWGTAGQFFLFPGLSFFPRMLAMGWISFHPHLRSTSYFPFFSHKDIPSILNKPFLGVGEAEAGRHTI